MEYISGVVKRQVHVFSQARLRMGHLRSLRLNWVAAQVVAGMLQKTVMTALPDSMAGMGMKYFEQASGGLTPQQRQSIESNMARLRGLMAKRDEGSGAGNIETDQVHQDRAGVAVSQPLPVLSLRITRHARVQTYRVTM